MQKKQLFALILLVCLAASLSLIKLPMVKAQSTETFGNTSSSGFTQDALWFAPTSPLMLNNFTTPNDVDIITAVSCYMDGYTAPIDACAVIYSNNPSTNEPDAVLAQSGDTYVNDTGLTWIDFNAFYLPVSPETTYWFGVFGSGDFSIVLANSNSWNTQLDYPSDTLSYDTPLNQQSVASWWYSTYAMAIYVSYTPTVLPTPTPTPIPTSSPTPNPSPSSVEIFGNNVVTGSGWVTDDALDWTYAPPLIVENFTSPSDFGVNIVVSVYMEAVSGSVDAYGVIYSDNNGFPATLLAQSSEVTGIGSSSYQWVTFTFDYTGLPNTVYWFGIFASADFNFYIKNTANNAIDWEYDTNTNLVFGDLSTQTVNWVTNQADNQDWIMGIYVSYNAPSSPSISPSSGGGNAGYPFTLTSPVPTQSNQSSPLPSQSRLNSGVLLLIIVFIVVVVAVTLVLSRPRKHRKH